MRTLLFLLLVLLLIAGAGLGGLWYWNAGTLTALPGSVSDLPVAAVDDSPASEEPEPVAENRPPAVEQPSPEEEAAVDEALKALDQRELETVRAVIDRLPAESVGRQLVVWLLAMSGDPALTKSEVEAAFEQPGNWPRPASLRRSLERNMLDGLGGTMRLQQALAGKPPETIEGAMALAQLNRDDAEAARALLVRFWHREVLAPRHELAIPVAFADILTSADHNTRYFNMMVRERIQAAERIVEHTDLAELHPVWAAQIRGQDVSGAGIEAVPEALLNSEAGIFMRVERLRKRGLNDEAAQLMAQLPEQVVNADAWWVERRIVSRSLREAGDVATAYRLAAAHRGGDSATQVEAAFHAGWYALSGGATAQAAISHFETMLAAATSDASRAKAHYWLGRAHTAAGDTLAANEAYARAARFSDRFHGQLAHVPLGRAFEPPPSPSVSQDELDAQAADPVFVALDMLARRGRSADVSRLVVEIAGTGRSPGVIAAAAGSLIRNGHHYAALRLAKSADADGLALGALTHPLGGLPMQADVTPEALALGHAVARQESEFRVQAISPADARGLLQVLPSTARDVAERLDLAYDAARLTRDPVYNTVIGSRYLDEQLARFDNSYVLTLIAYNAGPGRAREWIERFSDPRGLALDEAVDWIEQIPFPETRGYVEKVMENLQIYKALLLVETDIERDIRYGRRAGL